MYTIKKGKYYVKDSRYSNCGKSSYTPDPQKAVKFATREEALKNACGNESVVKMNLDWF